MNIAFSALLILYLALPGMLFWWAYRRDRGRPASRGPISDDIPIGLLLSFGLHAVWVLLFDLLGLVPLAFDQPRWFVDIESAVVLLSGQAGKESEPFRLAIQSISVGWRPLGVFAYFASLSIVAFFLGYRLRTLVRDRRLDQHIPFFRWGDWFYLLEGSLPPGWHDERDPPVQSPGVAVGTEPDFVVVAAREGEYIYRGILVDYVIGRSGDLETLILVMPVRKKLDHEPAIDQPEGGWVKVRSTFIVLKYAEVSNLAISRTYLPDLLPDQATDDDQGKLF
jgi:hypothetical protein